jgi:uncharacterized protein YbbK (DUF523 family)
MKPRVGVSACLLGEEVRWDGGHKRDDWITGTLGRLVQFVPVCPEVEIGLGVPRPPIGIDGEGRLRVTSTGEDLTDRMAGFAEARLAALDGIAGYVLKARSPSCGKEGVPHGDRRTGPGAFAAALLRRFPGIPVEDEVRLADPAVRAEFLRRIGIEGTP